MEFLSLLNVRLPGSEEEFCSHGFRYRDWRVEERSDQQWDEKTWF
jgi:hypothetical protein